MLLVAICVTAGAGCTDVRGYHGSWQGAVVDSPSAQVREGFAATVTATLSLDRVDTKDIAGRVSTSDGLLVDAPLVPIRPAANDVLGDISFAGDPLRTYFTSAATTDGRGAALVLVSLLPGDRAELRILRPASLYGVFRLRRD